MTLVLMLAISHAFALFCGVSFTLAALVWREEAREPEEPR